ncbi:MAG: DUF4097 family beta strand repeat-containing protein [Bacillota bacterium]|jgi:hypothetical protein
MENKIKEYIAGLFKDAPPTAETEEMQSEILRNTLDRYHDFIVEGKKPEIAYKKAVDQIGDVEKLLERQEDIKERRSLHQFDKASVLKAKHRQGLLMGTAVFLYINCVTPALFLGGAAADFLPSALLFVMIAAATGLVVYNQNTKLPKYTGIVLEAEEKDGFRKKSALRAALGVMLCILAVVPVILMESGGTGLLLICVGLGVGLLVYNKNSAVYETELVSLVNDDYAAWETSQDAAHRKLRVCRCIIWLAAAAFYLASNLLIWAWGVTWLIFLVALALSHAAKGLILTKDKTMVIVWSIAGVALTLVLAGGIFIGSSLIDFDGVNLNAGTVSYDHEELYSVGGAELSEEINALEINWPDGSITAEAYDGDTVQISEDGSGSENAELRYYLDGGRLIVQYCKSNMGVSGDVPHQKNLNIKIPRKTAEKLREIDISSTSGVVNLRGLGAENLTVDNISGGIDLQDMNIKTTQINTVSSDCNFSGVCDNMSFDSTSGSLNMTCGAQPSVLYSSTMSGNVYLVLPAETAGFTATLSSLSTDFETDFFTSVSGDGYVYGDGSGDFSLDTVSGKFSVMQQK